MTRATIFALVAVAVTSCGGSSSKGTDGGAAAGACNFPSCLQTLGAACVPAGACTSQLGTGAMTVCYENGLRYANNVATMAITVTNGATTCFTGEYVGQTGTSLGFTLRNAAGVAIATMTQDMSTGVASVTCAGGATVELDSACWGGAGCALGACP